MQSERRAESFKQSRLLISADTSIKHLAAECGTPLVEIALGGSNAHKTAAFSLGNRVIAGKSPCYPCRHSQKCPQKSHLCAESVSAEEVFAAACELLQSQGVTDKNETGKNEKENEKFERAVWTAYLDRTDVTYSLCPLIAKDLLKKTELLQQYQQSFESCENFNEIYTTLQVIAESKIDSGFYFQKLTQVFSDRFSSAESAFSALKRALEQSRDLLQMRIQIIHQTLSMEGETHAERT